MSDPDGGVGRRTTDNGRPMRMRISAPSAIRRPTSAIRSPRSDFRFPIRRPAPGPDHGPPREVDPILRTTEARWIRWSLRVSGLASARPIGMTTPTIWTMAAEGGGLSPIRTTRGDATLGHEVVRRRDTGMSYRLLRARLSAVVVVPAACGGITTGDCVPAGSDGGTLSGSSSSGAGSGSSGEIGTSSGTTGITTGTSGGPGEGGSSSGTTSGGAMPEAGTYMGDCTVTPCSYPYVCCLANNLCTHASSTECPSPVWDACTRASDCPNGEVCCVTAATTDQVGPSGSECRAACFTGANTPDGALLDQGPACNIGDPNGGVGDCPAPSFKCVQVPNSPASLGVCVPPP